MSQENLRMFYETVARDESLKAKIDEIAIGLGGRVLERSERDAIWVSQILPLAESQGFRFTIDDVRAVDQQGTGRLEDEELDAVVGAGVCICSNGGMGSGGEYTCRCMCQAAGVGYYSDGRQRCTCGLCGTGHDW